MRKWLVVLALAGVSVGAFGSLAACGEGSGTSVALVAYSTPREAYAELIPAFNKTTAGKGVSFTQSFGPSGDQALSTAFPSKFTVPVCSRVSGS